MCEAHEGSISYLKFDVKNDPKRPDMSGPDRTCPVQEVLEIKLP
jgi:hypothetical protein